MAHEQAVPRGGGRRFGSARKGPGGARGKWANVVRARRILPPVDYKDTELLSKYVTEQGKILPRRITRLSSKDQRRLSRVLKRSRHSGLLGFTIA